MRLRREQPVLITSAADPRHVDIRRRQSQYLFWMGFRVLCFVLAVVLFHGWIRFVAVGLALIIPWVAVVVANGGPPPPRRHPVGFQPASHAVGAGPIALEPVEHPVVDGDVQDQGPGQDQDQDHEGPRDPDDAAPGGPVPGPPRGAERVDVGFFGPRRPPRR